MCASLSLVGNSGRLTYRYPLLSVCVVFSCIQTMLWLQAFRMFNVRTDVYACDCTRGLYRHRRRVYIGNWLWEKNPLPHRGLEPASALRLAFQSDAVLTELFPPFVTEHHHVQAGQASEGSVRTSSGQKSHHLRGRPEHAGQGDLRCSATHWTAQTVSGLRKLVSMGVAQTVSGLRKLVSMGVAQTVSGLFGNWWVWVLLRQYLDFSETGEYGCCSDSIWTFRKLVSNGVAWWYLDFGNWWVWVLHDGIWWIVSGLWKMVSVGVARWYLDSGKWSVRVFRDNIWTSEADVYGRLMTILFYLNFENWCVWVFHDNTFFI